MGSSDVAQIPCVTSRKGKVTACLEQLALSEAGRAVRTKCLLLFLVLCLVLFLFYFIFFKVALLSPLIYLIMPSSLLSIKNLLIKVF